MNKILVLTCLFYAFSVSAQDSISIVTGAILEDIIENNDEGNYDFYSLYDELKTYLNNPLDLSRATSGDLRELGLLNDVQIEEIVAHRAQFGDFLSPYELQSIPSMNIGSLNAVIPFVGVGNAAKSKNIKSLFADANQNIVGKYKRVLQTKRGYTDDASSPYLGDANYYYLRYNLHSGQNLRIGLTMEKDAGEEFFTGSNTKGFDYYTGFLYLRDVHPLFTSINIGDYSISMGQGLILHNSFGSSKSSYVMNIKRGGRVIRPYSSVNESSLFRGIATTLSLTDHLKVTAFGSIKNIDGNTIQQDTVVDTGFGAFSSFVTSGLHRTQNEIDKRGTLQQKTVGGVIKYNFASGLRIGVNALHNTFDKKLTHADKPYKRFSFSGDKLINISADYSYRYENINLFGEIARSDNGGMALVQGALISMGRNIDGAIIYRKYDKDYHVLNSNAFGETSSATNEHGIYFALQMRPWRSITISSYFDMWSHPWLRSRTSAPSSGREFLTKIEYNKKRKFNLYLQYRYENKDQNTSLYKTPIRYLVPQIQHRARLNFTYKYNKELTLINRVEYNHFTKDGKPSEGYLLFQDVKYKPIEKPYSFALRYAVFDTDDFNSRIYAYENDVLYEFSIPFFSGSGTRFYIKARYDITRKLYVQLRYARTYFDDVKDRILSDGTYQPLRIGSGNEQITGNVRSDIKLVFKYKI